MEATKVTTVKDLLGRLRLHRGAGQRIVLTNGCFDLLHVGHIRCLRQARALGDILVVALNSDRSVASIKGAGRPIVPQQERAELVAALACVDYVVIFDQETPEQLIRALAPDVLVKGGDWTAQQVVGRQWVEGRGGRVVIIPFERGYSTSRLLSRIRGLPVAD